jgi:hypothetical protein
MKFFRKLTAGNLLVFCLACLIIAIFLKALANQNDVSVMLGLIGLVISGLSLIGNYAGMKKVHKILLTTTLIITCIAVLVFLQPEQCNFNNQLLDEMVDDANSLKNKFLAEKEYQLIQMDSSSADTTLHAFYSNLISTQLEREEIKKPCYKSYETKLQQWSKKEMNAFFNKRNTEIALCNDINQIIDEEDEEMINMLFASYNIDDNAKVLQIYENDHSKIDLGSLKLTLKGVILNGDNIRFKRIINIEKDEENQKITKVSFINQPSEKL